MRLGSYELAVATEFGPRITSLRKGDSPEFFVELAKDVVLQHSPNGVYRMRGGHRLWAAPEVPAVTYAPDDHSCQVVENPEKLTITAPADAADFVKEISVSVQGEKLVVDHRLTNGNDQPREVAPWAITQLRLGGVAHLPVRNPDVRNDLQADRSLVLWPYTELDDPRLSLEDGLVRIEGQPGPALKLGSSPDPGQLSYWLDGYLFTKTIEPMGDGDYADRGAIGQVFIKDAFVELESLGPIARLEPGQSTDHREIWEIVLWAGTVVQQP